MVELLHIELMFTRYSGVNTYWVEPYLLDIVELLHKEIMFTRYSGVELKLTRYYYRVCLPDIAEFNTRYSGGNTYRVEVYQISGVTT